MSTYFWSLNENQPYFLCTVSRSFFYTAQFCTNYASLPTVCCSVLSRSVCSAKILRNVSLYHRKPVEGNFAVIDLVSKPQTTLNIIDCSNRSVSWGFKTEWKLLEAGLQSWPHRRAHVAPPDSLLDQKDQLCSNGWKGIGLGLTELGKWGRGEGEKGEGRKERKRRERGNDLCSSQISYKNLWCWWHAYNRRIHWTNWCHKRKRRQCMLEYILTPLLDKTL